MRTIRTLLGAIRRTTNSLPHLLTALVLTFALTLPARAAETKIVDLSATNATSSELYNIANDNTWGTGDSQITAVITGTPGKKNSTAYTCFTGGNTKYYYPSLASGVAMEFKLPASGDFYISKVIINYVNNSSSNASNSAGYIFIDADGATMTGTNDKGSLTAQAYNACNNLTLTPTSLTAKSFKFGRNVNSVSGSEGRVAHIEIWVEEDASSGGGDIDCGGTPTLSPASLGAVTVDQYSTPSPLTFTATPQNGGTLTYQWYQWLDNETEADKIPAVGTGANTNSFTPDVTTASVRHYICLVSEAGCTNGAARLEVGAYTVNAATPPDGFCYEWGQGTDYTTAPANGSSVTIMNDFTVANSGATTTTTTVYSGSGSLSCFQLGGSGKNLIGNLGGKDIASIELGITTTSASNTTFVVVFATSTDFSASNIIPYTDAANTCYVGTAIANSAARSTVSITAPAGAKSFAVARNGLGVTTSTLNNSGSRNVWYVKACSASKRSVTYNANGATSGTAPTDANSPYSSGTTVTVLGNTGNLAKTGKNFAGWNTAADGSGTTYAAGATFTISQDVTLYALWEDPCLAPTINNSIGTFEYGQGETANAITVSATANNNGGALSYHWYQYEQGETPAQRIDAVGTGATTNSFTPSTATLGTRYFICEVREAGCSEVASITSGAFTVHKVRHQGWVIFDGTFDTSLLTSITHNAVTVDFAYTSANIADCSTYTNNADANTYLKSAKISMASSGGNLMFTVPEGYMVTQIDYAFAVAGGNRNIVIAKSFVTAADDEDVLFTGLTPGGSKTVKAGSLTSLSLEAGNYYVESVGTGGTFEILYLELTLALDPCTAPTISAAQAAENAATFAGGTVNYAADKTFTVLATAADAYPLKYEWYRNTVNSKTGATKIATTTTNTYTITNMEPTEQTYYFYCVIKSKSCAVETDLSGALVFNGEPDCVAPTNVTISGDYAYLAGQTVSLTATATGHTGILSYQWQKEISTGNWQDISGATSATYTKASCGYGDSGQYRCVVTAGSQCPYISFPYGIHVFSLNGGYDGEAWEAHDLVFTSGTTGQATIHLEAGRLFKFKITSNYEGYWYGNGQADYNGDGIGEHADDGWYTLQSISDWNFDTAGKNFRVYTGPEGDYVFTVDVQNALTVSPSVQVSVTYPTVTHPSPGYAYFEKPGEWDRVYLYWYSNDNWRLSDWWGSPEITNTATICGTTYYYTPLGASFDYLIFKDAGSNQWTYISSTGYSGKYLDKTDYANPAWTAFTDYTVTFAGNGSTAGTMAAVDDIPCGTSVTLPANAFTKEGNAFNGWVADVDVTVNNSAITAGGIIPDTATLQNVTSDITLTAQWCPVVNILSANAVGGSNNNITATGTIGGTAQCYLSSSKKLGTSGQYFFVKLAGGELMPGDIINLNLITASANGSYVGKVALFTGDKDNHTYYIDMPAPNVGDNFFTLPADFPSGVNGIGLYRDATHDHNPFINSITISRTNCAGLTAPTVAVSADNTTPCPGANITLTATTTPANAPVVDYKWFKADGTALEGNTASITVAPTETTEYYCVAYTLLFKAQSANVTITPKSVSISGADDVECTKTITLTGSGNGTWAITDGSSFATLSANSGTEVGLTGVAEGIVTVSFTYDGCSVSKTITVGPKLNDECMTFDAHTLNYQHSEGITTLYYINSSGVISQSQVFSDNQSIDALGTKGTVLSQKRFDLVFSRPVKTIILYGYGSDERTVAKVAVSPDATKNSYVDVPYSTTGSTYEAKLQTVVLTADSYFPSDKFIWIEFSNTLKVYRICVFYKETENLIFTTAGDWNTAGNWNLGYVPSSVDNATINAAASLATTGTEVNDLTIGSGSLEIAQTGMLKVNGTMLNNDDTKLTVNIPGGLAIADGMAAVRARVNFHSVAKVVNGNYRWQYIGWPFTALADVHWPFSGSWLATYVTTNEGTDMDWAYLSNGDGLTPFKGYALTQAAEKDFTFYGALNPPSTQNLDLTYLDDDHKWNLIANSWLAPINVATFNVATDFHNADATFHIFNTGSKAEYGEGAGGAEYNNAGQYTTITPEFAANKPNGISIPPMQGFFIEPNAPNASVTLDYNRHVLGAASYSEAGPMRTPRRERPVYTPVTMINITVKGEVFGDEVNLMESDKYTDGYDNGADGRKVLGAETSPQICAETAYGLMAILATPNLEGTIIDFRAGTEDQVYTLTFENNDGDIYITDLLTGTETKIEDENSYTFTASNTEELQARFRLSRTSVAPPDNPTSLEQTGAQGYSVINRDGTITIAAPANANIKYILFDAAGKTITQGTASGNVNIDVPQNGVYMLRIGNKTHKIVR